MPLQEWIHRMNSGSMPFKYYEVVAIVDERKCLLGMSSDYVVKFKASLLLPPLTAPLTPRLPHVVHLSWKIDRIRTPVSMCCYAALWAMMSAPVLAILTGLSACDKTVVILQGLLHLLSGDSVNNRI